MRDRGVACCPCFETLASLAPQHEVVVFQQVRPHPRVTASPLSLEEATNGSRECAPDDRLHGRLEGWAAIPICDSGYWIYPGRGLDGPPEQRALFTAGDAAAAYQQQSDSSLGTRWRD